MRRRVGAGALLVLALTPSAWLAWRWRAMPQLGLHQDDALYLVGAKSLAEGRGYRIDSLPGAPFQTKYPPMVSLLLAPLWKFGPAFPENLKLAALGAWLMLPVCLLAARAVFRDFGFGARAVWLFTLAMALNPLMAVLSTAIMSDLLFLALFLASLLLAQRALAEGATARLALAAGLVGGIAFLTRTAALPLVVTAPVCFACRRQFGRGLWFLAGMLPAVAGWQVWASTHMLQTRDPALLYYTNYFAMQLATVRRDNLAQVLWYNGDALLRSLGKLLMFDMALAENIHLQRIIGAAALAGTVRLVRRTGRLQYPAAAGGLAGLLLVYFYTADERLSLPLYPLVLMGFWTEVQNVCGAMRKSWNRKRAPDRAVAVVGAMALGALALFIAASYAAGHAKFLPGLYAACGRDLEAHRPAYEWIRTRTAAGATLNAYDDPVLYLYTGRRALGMPMPPSRVYAGVADRAADQFARDVARRAREHRLDYLLVTESDLYRERRAGLLRALAERDPQLRKEFASGGTVVYALH